MRRLAGLPRGRSTIPPDCCRRWGGPVKHLLAIAVLWATSAEGAPKIDTSGVMALFGNDFGHACPVEGTVPGEGIVYTARHSIRRGGPGGHVGPPFFFTWEDSTGRKGKAQPKNFDTYRDIGELATQGDTPYFYKKASAPPAPGEMVYWVQFRREDLRDETKRAKVKFYRAGYVFFDKPPDPGASGSCLFNVEGEVVGIVVWRIQRPGGVRGAATILEWLK